MNKVFPKCCENLVLNLISLTKGTVLFHLDVQRSLGIQWDLALNYLLVSFYLLCRVNLEMLRVAILSFLVALVGIPPPPPPILSTKYVNTCICIFLRGKSRFLMRFLRERGLPTSGLSICLLEVTSSSLVVS